jgi:chromosome segregation ATPase
MLDLPQITPEQFWMMMFAIVVFGAWQFVRLSSKAEAIQQEAQRLINDAFARQQARMDEQQKRMDEQQTRYNELLQKYTSLNALYNQAEQTIAELQGCSQEMSDELMSTKRKLAESERARGDMEKAIADMQITIRQQQKTIAEQETRIAELEKELKAQGVQMEQITQMLANSEAARKAAEAERDRVKQDYEALMADMNRRIEAAVAAKVVELQVVIAEKDAQIKLLEARLEEVLVEKGPENGENNPVLPEKSVSGDNATGEDTASSHSQKAGTDK